MRVAIIDPSLFTWPYDLALAEGLQANGAEVRIFGSATSREAPDAAPFLTRHFYHALTARPLAKLPKALERGIKGISHAADLWRLAAELFRWQPDVIHFQWAPLPFVDRLLLAKFRKIAPTLLTVHDSNPFNGNPAGLAQRLGSLAILRDFERLIVHTESARARVRSYVSPNQKIHCVPHGLLHGAAEARSQIAPAPPSDPVVFLTFGRIKPYKGIDVLIEAAALVPAELRSRMKIKVVGEPHMDIAPLEALRTKLGISDILEFDFRFLEDAEITRYLEESSVLVMPYREIDASGVLMVALASGRPVIASRLGNFVEWLTDEQEGFLVPPENPAALAASMSKLIADADLRTRMADNVNVLRDSVPGWRAIGKQTMEIYSDAIEAKPLLSR